MMLSQHRNSGGNSGFYPGCLGIGVFPVSTGRKKRAFEKMAVVVGKPASAWSGGDVSVKDR
jgi:hypothetical protein